jgi:formylmethanofuran dehydrogenase subunit E
MGMIGLRAVGAEGYFDVEVRCEGPLVKPPESCFLDGIQVGTGATLGKRSLEWVEAEKIVVRVKNTKTGKTVEVRPRAALLKMLFPGKSKEKADAADGDMRHIHEHLEAVARKIAVMPEEELVEVKEVAK